MIRNEWLRGYESEVRERGESEDSYDSSKDQYI